MNYRCICLLYVLFCYSCSSSRQAGTPFSIVASIPTIDQVGAPRLPATIAPVSAPFPLPAFKKTVFPALTISIVDKGATQQGITTKAIQASIDEVNSRGGGSVNVPAGKWLTGRIHLKSNVNLHIAEGAELHFSGAVEDYRPAVFTRNEGIELMSLGALIYANGQENIAVTGKGTLLGPASGSVKDQTMTADVIENVVPLNKPVSERIYEGYNKEIIFPPMFISPINCRNVYIEGVTLRQTAFWNIVPVYCDGVIIRGVSVYSVGIPRGDGIDIESSRNVLIEYCTLSSGDDCFTIKAGRGEDGMRVNKASENIVIRFCLALEGHGGITLGSETAGMIRNVSVQDCVFNETGVGIRFKTRRPRGGGGENIYYERIRMILRGEAFKFDMLGSKTHVGELANRLPARAINTFTPHFSRITARDLIVEKASMFIDITGIPETPVEQLLIENATINSRKLIAARDVKGFTVRNAVINTQDSVITVLDGRDLLFDRVQFNTPGRSLRVNRSGELTDSIRFLQCSPAKPIDWPMDSYRRQE